MAEVTLYSRPGCHLCEDAERQLRILQRDLAFELRVVDIESDDALLQRYMLEIPVIAVSDAVVARAPIDARALAATLRSQFEPRGP